MMGDQRKIKGLGLFKMINQSFNFNN